MAIGKPFAKGTSGNPSGRVKGFERAAREEADQWAAGRGITGEHAGMRAVMRVAFERIDTAGIEDKDRLGYLKFVTERFAGKPKETVELVDESVLTPEQIAETERAIALEQIAKMSREERAQLLAMGEHANETVQ